MPVLLASLRSLRLLCALCVTPEQTNTSRTPNRCAVVVETCFTINKVAHLRRAGCCGGFAFLLSFAHLFGVQGNCYKEFIFLILKKSLTKNVDVIFWIGCSVILLKIESADMLF